MMSSELQRQVSVIKRQHAQVQLLKDGKPSLFLSAKEAARVDISAVFEAATSGINALIQYDNRFSIFLNDILHESSVDIQRSLRTKEVCGDLCGLKIHLG